MPTQTNRDLGGISKNLIERNVYNPNTYDIYKVIYLSPTGNDDNPGTEASPMKTISGILKKYLPGSLEIVFLPGEYTEDMESTISTRSFIYFRAKTPGTVTLNVKRILFYYLLGVRLSDLTINCSPASNAGLRFSYCNFVYIYGCTINRQNSGSTDALMAFYVVQAYLESCTITANSVAPIAIYTAQASYLRLHNCAVTANTYQIDANTLSDVGYFNCTFGGSGTLRPRNGGSIVERN